MYCTQSNLVNFCENVALFSSGSEKLRVNFEEVCSDFGSLLQELFTNQQLPQQLDFVLLTSSPTAFLQDLRQVLQSFQNIFVQSHKITPFQDLLGSGTLQSLTQLPLNQCISRLQKIVPLNSRVIFTVKQRQIRFLVLDCKQINKPQQPERNRIIAFDLRKMEVDSVERLFNLYGEPQIQYDDRSFEQSFEYLERKAASYPSNVQEPQKAVEPQPVQVQQSQPNQNIFQQSRVQNIQKEKSSPVSILNHFEPVLEIEVETKPLNSPKASNPQLSRTINSLKDLNETTQNNYVSQIRTLERQFEELRKEKMIVEKGKNKLIEENENMKNEIADLNNSLKTRQNRITKLENQIKSIGGVEIKQENEELKVQNSQLVSEVEKLKSQLQAAEKRVHKLMNSSQELRNQMKMMAEVI
ncbi:Hypothetical_protein [Hexamita inflata]|uniref:Hypothetical_protein n=1 Tax=Hexamita inflata TaxID=28002 RepID=A0AA86PDV5_9EUKA|nr:Hypothetical protein HINF_LOCUS24831 [Hexamita inflata]CAI9953996.1 Hypothetical protein HINF_LOCUS41641 [Hexamita inflata]